MDQDEEKWGADAEDDIPDSVTWRATSALKSKLENSQSGSLDDFDLGFTLATGQSPLQAQFQNTHHSSSSGSTSTGFGASIGYTYGKPPKPKRTSRSTVPLTDTGRQERQDEMEDSAGSLGPIQSKLSNPSLLATEEESWQEDENVRNTSRVRRKEAESQEDVSWSFLNLSIEEQDVEEFARSGNSQRACQLEFEEKDVPEEIEYAKTHKPTSPSARKPPGLKIDPHAEVVHKFPKMSPTASRLHEIRTMVNKGKISTSSASVLKEKVLAGEYIAMPLSTPLIEARESKSHDLMSPTAQQLVLLSANYREGNISAQYKQKRKVC